ncbi:MAG: hypothetical protein R2848_06535 [Thermomicrobiales bacterium]
MGRIRAGFDERDVRAAITLALVTGEPLPTPEALGVDDPPYLNALAEAADELRRQVLDAVRTDDFARGEQLMARMDEVYAFLVTVDYPDGLTGGLRRTTGAPCRARANPHRSDHTGAASALSALERSGLIPAGNDSSLRSQLLSDSGE